MRARTVLFSVLVILFAATASAQLELQAAGAGVPPVIRFSGTLAQGEGRATVTFALYRDQAAGEPLWAETQAVAVDAGGRYSVVLGIVTPLPREVFAAGAARWLGVRPEGQAEPPRVLLVSVPYALKAGDAETIGGKPLSAFVLAGNKTGTGADGLTYVDARVLQAGLSRAGSGPESAGTPGYLGMFTDTTTLGNSVLFQWGSSIGLGTTAPAAALHVMGSAAPAAYFDVYNNALGALPVVYRAARGTPQLPSAVQTDDILGGLAVRGYGTSAFSTGRGQVMFKAAENWTDEHNGTYLQITTTPLGSITWAERLRITPDGKVGIGTATPGQTLSVAGTIESTTGGFKFPDGTTQTTAATTTLGANTFTATQTITSGNLGLPGTATSVGGALPGSGVMTLGGRAFLHRYGDLTNAFVGDLAGGAFAITATPNCSGICPGDFNTGMGYAALFATTTGFENSAFGSSALAGNTSGAYNNAFGTYSLFQNAGGARNNGFGSDALYGNSSGTRNSAFGDSSLEGNQTGSYNSAFGASALFLGNGDRNTGVGFAAGVYSTGNYNTFLGAESGVPSGTPALTNATAIGYGATVLQSNSLVLGANGVKVGIGTDSPAATLHIKESDDGNADMILLGSTSTKGVALFDTGSGVDLQAYGAPLYINFLGTQKTIVNPFANANGYVGIGTPSPDMMLTVNGGADKPGGGSWATFSDARLKTLGGGFHAGLAEVLKLQPTYYRYTDQNALGIADRDQHVGFVAQEVAKVIPEAVTRNSQGYLLVNNDPILWAMLNAIKEQQALIEKQAAAIKAQQEQIAQLVSQARAVQAALARKDGTRER